jgi:hypothetical protein
MAALYGGTLIDETRQSYQANEATNVGGGSETRCSRFTQSSNSARGAISRSMNTTCTVIRVRGLRPEATRRPTAADVDWFGVQLM